ncbi:MAG: FHA domain-containing protein [Acidobacteria bacterium]|nr:MAG: FHA domain-containing protein [Acidobacteriota bacterium]
MMLRLRYVVDGEERLVPLAGSELRLGRSSDNEVLLPDYSVSRHHARIRRDGDVWWIYDLKSTNGVLLNQTPVESSPLAAGDRLRVGVFEIVVEAISSPAAGESGGEDAPLAVGSKVSVLDDGRTPVAGEPAISNATIVRSLSEWSADYGLDDDGPSSSAVRKRQALDEAYGSQVFGFLTRLARFLITAESVDEVLERVLEIAFDALPVDRGFILLRDEESGELACEMMRIKRRIERRPQSVPVSKTMLEAVMRERVALLTFDALSDRRLAGTESVRIHQIRAAMCAPLWSGEKIIGVLQLDSPHQTGTFTEQDVDLLTALANYAAVAIERLRNARKVELEREVRSRLERYHSPAVIEEVIAASARSGVESSFRRLRPATVSVLFADVVGFTAFCEKAAPEEVAEVMESFFTHAVEAIFELGGTLDKFIGDCVMAFFGAPMAQSDHARRAVAAAVRIQRELRTWNAERRRRQLPAFEIRIGINSGPVVVGDIGSKRRVDYTVLGNTVNVASRLEASVARPGEVVIGAETHRLLAGAFPAAPLGEIQVKGLSQPITAYRVALEPPA